MNYSSVPRKNTCRLTCEALHYSTSLELLFFFISSNAEITGDVDLITCCWLFCCSKFNDTKGLASNSVLLNLFDYLMADSWSCACRVALFLSSCFMCCYSATFHLCEKAKLSWLLKRRGGSETSKGNCTPACSLYPANCLYAGTGNYHNSHCSKEMKAMKINKVVSRRWFQCFLLLFLQAGQQTRTQKIYVKFEGFEPVPLLKRLVHTEQTICLYYIYVYL